MLDRAPEIFLIRSFKRYSDIRRLTKITYALHNLRFFYNENLSNIYKIYINIFI